MRAFRRLQADKTRPLTAVEIRSARFGHAPVGRGLGPVETPLHDLADARALAVRQAGDHGDAHDDQQRAERDVQGGRVAA